MTAASLGAVDLLRDIRDTYAAVAENHKGERQGEMAAAWSAAADAAIAALTPAAGGDDELLDAAEAMLRWLVKNVDLWHFPQYDDLHRACTNRRAAPAPPPAATDEAMQRAYWLGWRNAAAWADRKDLWADSGSPAYLRERDDDLHTLRAALSAPPPADAVRALVGQWRERSGRHALTPTLDVLRRCADELEAALSAAPESRQCLNCLDYVSHCECHVTPEVLEAAAAPTPEDSVCVAKAQKIVLDIWATWYPSANWTPAGDVLNLLHQIGNSLLGLPEVQRANDSRLHAQNLLAATKEPRHDR